ALPYRPTVEDNHGWAGAIRGGTMRRIEQRWDVAAIKRGIAHQLRLHKMLRQDPRLRRRRDLYYRSPAFLSRISLAVNRSNFGNEHVSRVSRPGQAEGEPPAIWRPHQHVSPPWISSESDHAGRRRHAPRDARGDIQGVQRGVAAFIEHIRQ